MSVDSVTAAGPLRAVVEGLLRAGVRDVIICPGSRSMPMALALRAAAELRCWVHLDERAGAFFALGAAKGSRRPVALLATSGTAVVNFAPAVAEARYGRVPLIVLTADRPPELQGVGSPQTIDQVELYGRHAKWYAELPLPDASQGVESEVRKLVARAAEVATAAPPGPVQVNMPFREPLLPLGPLSDVVRGHEPADDQEDLVPAAGEVDRLVELVRAARQPLVVCGPMDTPGLSAALTRLAAVIGAPLLADALSNLRHGSHDLEMVVAHYDGLLRSPRFAEAHRPDLVLRFGGTPTSKALNKLLEALEAPQVLIDAAGGWEAPQGLAPIAADPTASVVALLDRLDSSAVADPAWADGWRVADAAAWGALAGWLGQLDEPFEGAVPVALEAALPAGSVVVAGNSMPVRDIDAFMPTSQTPRRMLGNRGANGIDGLLSTAFGIAVAQPAPVVAVVGDLSFLHDLNALVAARRLSVDATVVLVNNDGGGIFSFLPQASAQAPDAGLPQHYEELFGTPHGIEFGPVVRALGARHSVVDQRTLQSALNRAVGRPGVDVLELRTERARNVELHREAFAVMADAIEVTA